MKNDLKHQDKNITDNLLSSTPLPFSIANELGEKYDFNIFWIITLTNKSNEFNLYIQFTDNKKNNTICIQNDTTHFRPVKINYNNKDDFICSDKGFITEILTKFPQLKDIGFTLYDT